MTVYEYLIRLPQSLFEATLMGLMGVGMSDAQEATFHDWMNSPYEESFPNCEKPVFQPSSMTMILGKAAETLPADKQEQLKHAMREYCEVCDYINQNLVDQQKKSE